MESKLLKINKALGDSTKVGQSVAGKPGYVYALSPSGNLEAVKANKDSKAAAPDKVVNGKVSFNDKWLDPQTGMVYKDPNNKEHELLITDSTDKSNIKKFAKRLDKEIHKDGHDDIKASFADAMKDRIGAKNLKQYFDKKSKDNGRELYSYEKNKVYSMIDSANAKMNKVKFLLQKHTLKESNNAKQK